MKIEVYEAHLYFLDSETNEEHLHKIQFLTANDAMAVADTVAWAEDRHKAIPEYFYKITVLKLWRRGFNSMEASGYLPQAPMKLLMHWQERYIRYAADHLQNIDIKFAMPTAIDPLLFRDTPQPWWK